MPMPAGAPNKSKQLRLRELCQSGKHKGTALYDPSEDWFSSTNVGGTYFAGSYSHPVSDGDIENGWNVLRVWRIAVTTCVI